MKLFNAGICEYCGRTGEHPECERAAMEAELRYKRADAEQLQTHSRFGSYGVRGPESEKSFRLACAVLEGYLERPAAFDPDRAIEGDCWWFLPEGWIGMIGFVVEKQTSRLFPLGSGLASWGGAPHAGAVWAAIHQYLSGNVQPVNRDEARD